MSVLVDPWQVDEWLWGGIRRRYQFILFPISFFFLPHLTSTNFSREPFPKGILITKNDDIICQRTTGRDSRVSCFFPKQRSTACSLHNGPPVSLRFSRTHGHTTVPAAFRSFIAGQRVKNFSASHTLCLLLLLRHTVDNGRWPVWWTAVARRGGPHANSFYSKVRKMCETQRARVCVSSSYFISAPRAKVNR